MSTSPEDDDFPPVALLGIAALFLVLLIVLLAVLQTFDPPDPCRSSDGPQFRCWLQEVDRG
jgi:uncharacterized protein involved in outer membrane biogenesis